MYIAIRTHMPKNNNLLPKYIQRFIHICIVICKSKYFMYLHTSRKHKFTCICIYIYNFADLNRYMILTQTNIRWQFVTYFSATSIKMYAWLWTSRVCRIFCAFYFTFILSFFFLLLSCSCSHFHAISCFSEFSNEWGNRWPFCPV